MVKRRCLLRSEVHQDCAFLCACSSDFTLPQNRDFLRTLDTRSLCDQNSLANGDFSAMRTGKTDSHCGNPCGIPVCGEKLLANGPYRVFGAATSQDMSSLRFRCPVKNTRKYVPSKAMGAHSSKKPSCYNCLPLQLVCRRLVLFLSEPVDSGAVPTC